MTPRDGGKAKRRPRNMAERKPNVKLHTNRARDSAALATQALDDGNFAEASGHYRDAAKFCILALGPLQVGSHT